MMSRCRARAASRSHSSCTRRRKRPPADRTPSTRRPSSTRSPRERSRRITDPGRKPGDDVDRPPPRTGRASFPSMNQIRSAFLFGSLAGALAAAAPARAQTIPSSAYGALRWRLIGPHRGGRVLAVAGIPGDPATFYFGAVDGGVWRTRNAGVTWDPLFDDQPIASIGALALAPSDPNVIYVGTGEAAIRSDITYGAGVYKSNDGGAHWRAVGLADTRHIGKVLVDPRNPDVVLVAALGHAYGPNSERGVFRATDGGRTWNKIL